MPGFNRTRLLAFSFIAEGTFYIAYSFWRTMIYPLRFYRVPPLIESMSHIFLLLIFLAGVFFISRAFGLLKGRKKLSGTDLVASLCLVPLWSIPALTAFGNADTYLTDPHVPEEFRPYGIYCLQVGIIFVALGMINLLSLYLIRHKTP